MYQVMIVDDDPTSLAIGKALLQSKYLPILMRSGTQALGYLAHHPLPDIILLDMLMPGVSGIEVLRALKSSDVYRHIPVLFLTSMDDMNFENECYALGAVDCIQKPVTPILLEKKLERQAYILDLQYENVTLRKRLSELETPS